MRATTAALAGGLALLASQAAAQKVSFTATSDLTFVEGTRTQSIPYNTGPPTGKYSTYASKITLTGHNSSTTSSTGTMSSFGSLTTGANMTATSTSAEPTNTQPCNNHIEFCTRKYSNITFVGAHNSPFVRPGNSASNQARGVTTQLDDGVRFLQAQIQWPTNASVPHFCHSSCDLLDAGPITKWLGEVKSWVDDHPFDVVTILLGNGNYSTPDLYAPYIESTGILKYTYEAPFLPMALEDWPTMENLILRGKRVVMFMDYMADQKKFPWLLDEFSQVWETQFDPIDSNFPCTVQRPPDLSANATKGRMYIMNHNLNAEFNVFGAQLLVPAVNAINETNGLDGNGSVGLAANNCRSDWGRAPNVLNVDYYNYGHPRPCSVFEAAARVNNVTYSYDSRCGIDSAATTVGRAVVWTALVSFLLSTCLVV